MMNLKGKWANVPSSQGSSVEAVIRTSLKHASIKRSSSLKNANYVSLLQLFLFWIQIKRNDFLINTKIEYGFLAAERNYCIEAARCFDCRKWKKFRPWKCLELSNRLIPIRNVLFRIYEQNNLPGNCLMTSSCSQTKKLQRRGRRILAQVRRKLAYQTQGPPFRLIPQWQP